MNQGGTPGSHGRNWQPADNIEDYLRNCREGLENYSERHLAKLLGMSRIKLYRTRMVAAIPESLFERLLSSREVIGLFERPHSGQDILHGAL